jgi:cold-inducible RNA-binding protein
LETEGLGIF